MSSRKINSQRMYKIPFRCLDLLLVQLTMLRTDTSYFEMEWLFKEEDSASVVINEFGHYPYQMGQLIEFVNNINKKYGPEYPLYGWRGSKIEEESLK